MLFYAFEIRESGLITLAKYSAKKYGSVLLQGKRSQFTRVMSREAQRLGVDFRYGADVTGYSDSELRPAVMLRGGELVRGDVSFSFSLDDSQLSLTRFVDLAGRRCV